MKNIFEKLISKVLPFILCICIVSGAVAPAYATAGPYDQGIYNNTLTIMQYSSSSNTFLSNIYTLLSQFKTNFDSFAASWNTSTFLPNSLLNNINSTITTLNNNFVNNTHDYSSTITDIYNTLVLARSDIYTINSNVDNIYTWVMAIGQALAGIQTDVSSIASDTSNLPDIKLDTANLSGIKTDTANIVDIKTLLNSNVSVPWSYFYRYYDSQNNENMPTVVNGNGLLNLNFYKAGSGVTLRVQQNVQNYNANPLQAIGVLNNNVVNLGSLLYGFYRYYPRNVYNSDTNNLQELVTSNGSGRAYSIMDSLTFIHNDLLLPLAKLQFFIADDQSIQAKKANASQTSAFVNNFTGSGSASASPSDFGAVKDSIVDLKAGFNGGASSSDTFGFLSGDSNAWDWFTQDIANDLDRTQGSNTRLLRSSSDVAYDTPLLDGYYTSILSILGGDN